MEYIRDARGQIIYTNGFPRKPQTKTVETVYGDDGKLVNGEYNHKMYKNGKLLTGPLNGAYYVNGIQDDTFTGTGTDGLKYENGKPFTGSKTKTEYTDYGSYKITTYYKDGKKINGWDNDTYYIEGIPANGVKTVNGEKINFKDGKPCAKVVKTMEYIRDARGQIMYTNDFPRKPQTITFETIYGDDGKLINGEYNHKMYKDGKLLTGPLNGVYYVDGIQDDNFKGKGTDGLIYENGKPFTGSKTHTEYNTHKVWDEHCQTYREEVTGSYKVTVWYKDGAKIEGYDNGLYYVEGILANGVKTVNGEKINFKNGRPAAKLTGSPIYGDDGKLVNGEYNHKMYKDGKLLTGPLNGAYYVDGIQDDTFTGTGTDGLKYENGEPFTGSKTHTEYNTRQVWDDKCQCYREEVTGSYKVTVWYKNGAKIEGYNDGLYYVEGILANGVKTVNGEKINFKDGRPAAKTNGTPIYGDDGKLVNGEYNHKMYKDGKLLTGPLNGAYYVDGIQDDTFKGIGKDGLMYENGKPFTGTKNGKYYKNGVVANGFVV